MIVSCGCRAAASPLVHHHTVRSPAAVIPPSGCIITRKNSMKNSGFQLLHHIHIHVRGPRRKNLESHLQRVWVLGTDRLHSHLRVKSSHTAGKMKVKAGIFKRTEWHWRQQKVLICKQTAGTGGQTLLFGGAAGEFDDGLGLTGFRSESAAVCSTVYVHSGGCHYADDALIYICSRDWRRKWAFGKGLHRNVWVENRYLSEYRFNNNQVSRCVLAQSGTSTRLVLVLDWKYSCAAWCWLYAQHPPVYPTGILI